MKGLPSNHRSLVYQSIFVIFRRSYFSRYCMSILQYQPFEMIFEQNRLFGYCLQFIKRVKVLLAIRNRFDVDFCFHFFLYVPHTKVWFLGVPLSLEPIPHMTAIADWHSSVHAMSASVV